MAKPRILVIGSSTMSLNLKTKYFPERGEEVITNFGYTYTPSGISLTSAIAIAKLNSDSMICTRIGDDIHGDKIKSLFLKHNIDPRFIVTDKKRSTGLSTVITDASGISRTISCKGANAGLCDTDLEEAFISYPDAVLIQGDISCDNIYEAVYLANKKKIPVMFDPSHVDFDEFDFNALGNVEIFSPNADEAFAITGIRPDGVESCLRACIKIINKFKCHYVIIKLGEKGCFVFDGVYSEIAPSFDTEICDRGGVGSIFDAGFIYMYTTSRDVVKASVYANICASIALSRQGTFESAPTFNEVEAFIINNKLNFD